MHILHGYGREVSLWPAVDDVYEGQFKDGELDGFGRHMTLHDNGDYECHTGFWKEGERNGYIKILKCNFGQVSTEEGIYEKDEFKPDIDIMDWYDEEQNTLDFQRYTNSYMAKDP
jgi:hypothetical protein